jgi:hypothetical protein
MGQYYVACNLDKRQFIKPHDFGDGAKLMEFGPSPSGMMLALAILLADGNDRGGGDLHSSHPVIGSWAGDRVVITGDYADEGKFLDEETLQAFRAACPGHQYGKYIEAEEPVNLYTVASILYTNVGDEVMLAIADDPYEKETLKKTLEGSAAWRGKRLRPDLVIKLGMIDQEKPLDDH